MKLLPIMAVAAVAVSIAVPAEARKHHYSRGGSCDGIHRCVCGSTQTAHFGLPRMYNGHNLWQASEWARAFPRTSIHAGAVGVKPHHVYRVVQVTGPGRAIVADERGQYERNVSGDTFVDPNGNGVTRTASAKTRRSHHHHVVASAEPQRWNAP